MRFGKQMVQSLECSSMNCIKKPGGTETRYIRPGDVFVGLSTSGNSKNVVEAAKVAKKAGLTTVALTGESGGALLDICDVTIRVPAKETYLVQEYHLPVYHAICAEVEERLFGKQ